MEYVHQTGNANVLLDLQQETVVNLCALMVQRGRISHPESMSPINLLNVLIWGCVTERLVNALARMALRVMHARGCRAHFHAMVKVSVSLWHIMHRQKIQELVRYTRITISGMLQKFTGVIATQIFMGLIVLKKIVQLETIH